MIIPLLLGFTFSLAAALENIFIQPDQNIVLETKRLSFEDFPDAFNPSLTKIDEGYLLIFRYCPDLITQYWISEIGFVVLNENFDPISEPQLLNTRPRRSKTPSQAEDARIFSYRGKTYLTYNDNIDEIYFDGYKRRDIFMVELIKTERGYTLSNALKITNSDKYAKFSIQKNWVPFEWNSSPYFSYSLNPHEVHEASLKNGSTRIAYESSPSIQWDYGQLRGGTPPIVVDGKNLAFFHSSMKIVSPSSHNQKLLHYFMGAYTFSLEPPFEIDKMSKQPIVAKSFYPPSFQQKRVIFPGGAVYQDPYIYVAYGKDDCEIWIAKLSKEALMNSLLDLQKEKPRITEAQ